MCHNGLTKIYRTALILMSLSRSRVMNYKSGETVGEHHQQGATPLQNPVFSAGVELAHYRHPPTELPDNSYQQHLLVIHTEVPSPTRVEQVTAGHYQTGEVKTGDIILVPAQTIHRVYWNHEHTYLALWLAPQRFEQCLGDAISGQSVEVLPQFITPDSSLYGIGLALRGELETLGQEGQLYMDSLIAALSAHLLRHYCNLTTCQPFSPGCLPRYKLHPVLEYIHAHLDRNLSLAELATIARISPNYFLTQFKQATGRSPHQYIIHQRIEKAKVMLIRQNMAIAEVAYELGFSHQSHFTRHFKRQVGVTPKRFLAQS